MSMKILDADAIMARATPVAHQHAHEIQPYGHLVRMPIALSETACKASVENLNQLLADTITLRDMYKKHHWQVAGPARERRRPGQRTAGVVPGRARGGDASGARVTLESRLR